MFTATTATESLKKARAAEVQRVLASLDVETATLDVVVPCHNEAPTLATNITKLYEYLGSVYPGRFTIAIADSGSTDGTRRIAEDLADGYPAVRVVTQDVKGRGRALKAAWRSSRADIVMYMDEDLSTDLRHIPELVAPLVDGTAALAVGSRRLLGSDVKRSFKREFISRSYIRLLKLTLGIGVSDAQCGFKALRRDAAEQLLPRIHDDAWFFDTELIVKTERAGYGVAEIPVQWVEDKDSRVNLVRTAVDDLKGIDRVRREQGKWLTGERLALVSLLVFTAGLYLVNLTVSGYANSFYAASVQAATQSWKALFFGSLDAANFITVDKPPVALWLMGLSGRIFGFSSFSMLLPNALAGIATVYLVYKIVRRWFEPSSALLAGLVMALTPVAALMFRFNNPDSFLTLFLTASVYAFVRAIDAVRARSAIGWLSLAGVFTGLAFNTKMMQGLLVLPVLALVYLYAAKPPFLRRLQHLLFAAIPTAIATLWWPVVVALTPAANRPYIGSSTDNNIWNLIFGYNGFGRLLGTGQGMGGGRPGGGFGGGMGQSLGQGGMGVLPGGAGGFGGGPGGGGGMGPGGSGFGGSTGLLRMFNGDFGPNIAWLLPLALVSLGVALWLLRRAPRTDKRRVAFLVWGGWLVLHIIVFSMVSGVIHPYYVVALAPAVAALVGMGLPWLWKAYKQRRPLSFVLPVTVAASAVVACVILGYQSVWPEWVHWVVLLSGLSGAGLLLYNLYQPVKRFVQAGAIASIIALSIGPVGYTFATVRLAHTGSVPTAGPVETALQGSNNEQSQAESTLVSYLLAHQGSAKWIVAVDSANTSAALQILTGQPVMAIGGFNGSDQAITLAGFKQLVSSGQVVYYAVNSGGRSGMRGGGGPGGQGNSEILSWVQSAGTVVDYGGSQYTLYKLSNE